MFHYPYFLYIEVLWVKVHFQEKKGDPPLRIPLLQVKKIIKNETHYNMCVCEAESSKSLIVFIKQKKGKLLNLPFTNKNKFEQ